MRLTSLAILLSLTACDPLVGGTSGGTDGGTHSDTGGDTTLVDAPCDDADLIDLTDADVTGDVLLDGRCYSVAGRLVASGGVLTLAAGTRITFAQDASMEVASTGRLTVQGTVTRPVELVGRETIAGFWQGLAIRDSVSPDNTIGSLRITDAGGDAWSGDPNASGALFIGENVAMRIQDLRIERSGLRPVYVSPVDTSVSITSLSVVDAGDDPWLPLDTVATIEGMDFGPDPYAGRVVVVDASVTEDLVLPELEPSVELAIRGTLWVSDGTLTLSPGAHLTFGGDDGLQVVAAGALDAAGSDTRSVLLEGQAGGRGAWLGLWFNDSTTPSSMTRTTVRSGGGAPWTGEPRASGGVLISGAAAVAMDQVNIVEGLGPGISVLEDPAVLQLDDVNVGGHEVAARISADTVARVADTSAGFRGNDDDRIFVFGGTVRRGNTWSPETPLVLERSVFVSADLTLRPGTTVQGAGIDIGMQVSEGGSLSALGELDDPVVFEATESAAGSWMGLGFRDSRSDRNLLDNVVIRGGGGKAWSGNGNHTANLFLAESVVEIVRTRIENSALYPIALAGPSILEGCTDLVLVNNAVDTAWWQSPSSYCGP